MVSAKFIFRARDFRDERSSFEAAFVFVSFRFDSIRIGEEGEERIRYEEEFCSIR